MNIDKLFLNLKNHNIDAVYFNKAKEAVDYLKRELKNKKIAFGGSVTLQQIGLYDELEKQNNVCWHWRPDSFAMGAHEAEVYICSANGISEEGEIINIDGKGNRVSESVFGPEATYFVCGINKVAPDFASAMYRARNVAAPKNAERLKKNTPCAEKADKCYNCQSEDRICNIITTVLAKPNGVKKMEVVIIGEELGY